MDQLQCGLSRNELAFLRMKEFHLQRVNAVEHGNVPLSDRAGGILVLHLIPERHALERRILDTTTLKEHGARIRPLGDHGGNQRFNVDGYLNQSGRREVRAYSQLFRDGRLESVMSDVGYPLNHQADKGPYAIRSALIERAVFEVVEGYLKFSQAVGLEPPLWLFSTLVDCKGFRLVIGQFRDVSDSAVDRSPAILPELEIADFSTDIQQLLQPWCDALWQSGGLERSFNYDQDGKWRAPN